MQQAVLCLTASLEITHLVVNETINCFICLCLAHFLQDHSMAVPPAQQAVLCLTTSLAASMLGAPVRGVWPLPCTV
jgi:hypothetical protein